MPFPCFRILYNLIQATGLFIHFCYYFSRHRQRCPERDLLKGTPLLNVSKKSKKKKKLEFEPTTSKPLCYNCCYNRYATNRSTFQRLSAIIYSIRMISYNHKLDQILAIYFEFFPLQLFPSNPSIFWFDEQEIVLTSAASKDNKYSNDVFRSGTV